MSEQSDEQLAAELAPDVPADPDRPDPWAGRHMSVQHFEHLFEYQHLPEHLRRVSAWLVSLARLILDEVSDGPELSACLRKLLEAKDCAVRQAVLDNRGRA
jgi:hypothetical protein